MTTRRELIKGAAGLTAAASLGAGTTSAAAAVAPGSEGQALSNALRLERAGLIAYRQVLATGVVSAAVSAQLRMLVAENLKHAAKREQVLSQLGVPLPQGRAA